MSEFTVQQGWQCPICKRVYSPLTFMCYYCGDNTVTTTSTGTGTFSDIDWKKQQTVTTTNNPDKIQDIGEIRSCGNCKYHGKGAYRCTCCDDTFNEWESREKEE